MLMTEVLLRVGPQTPIFELGSPLQGPRPSGLVCDVIGVVCKYPCLAHTAEQATQQGRAAAVHKGIPRSYPGS